VGCSRAAGRYEVDEVAGLASMGLDEGVEVVATEVEGTSPGDGDEFAGREELVDVPE